MDRETAKVTRGYVRKVKKKYPDAKIFLFGSRAREDNWVSSDFDFLVVSKEFVGKPISERIKSLLKMWSYHRDADIICLTPEEMKKDSVLLRVASRGWIQLA